MKSIFKACATIALIGYFITGFVQSAHAHNVESVDGLQANSAQTQNAQGTAASVIQTGAVAINSYGADSVRTVGNAPSMAFGSSLSPDLCEGSGGIGGGWLGGALSLGATFSKDYCVDLRTFERLQQGAASESRLDVKLALKDASYEVLADISPKVRAALVKHGVIKDETQVADQNATLAIATRP